MLVVAVINVVVYTFWHSQTSPVTLTKQELVFSGCTVLPDGKKTKLGSSDQETSPSGVKNYGVVLVPCHAWKCVPTTTSGGVNICKNPGYHLLHVSSQ